MKRTNKKLRSIASCFLLIMVQNICMPAVSWALTSGPTQPEYSSYESLGSTDMVNLTTGDFSYTMPLVEVPSPEGGFTLPLSYHAGIGLEEEASWVGLGWSVNPGAINRSASQYPDDFSGEALSTTITNSGGEGYAINFLAGTVTYDSQKGYGGTIGWGSTLAAGWGTQAGLTALGVTFSSRYDNGVNVDPVGVVMSAVDILSLGSGTLATGVGNLSTFYAVGSLGASLITGNGTTSMHDWTVKQKNFVFFQKYKYYLDQTKIENMYGSLYLGRMGTIGGLSSIELHEGQYVQDAGTSAPIYDNVDGSRPASDMHMNVGGANNAYSIEASSIAYDNFNVMGEGVSGNIKPYRHEIGALAFPHKGDMNYKRLKIDNFVDYKANFRYDGDVANNYLFHKGTVGALFTPSNPNYGMDKVISGSGTSQILNWVLQDNYLYQGNTEEDFHTREGLKNKQLTSSRYIKWFSNEEIRTNTATSSGLFMDFCNSTDRATFRSNSNVPLNGIGGFSITRSDGFTYHYALPVYNNSQYSFSQTRYTNSVGTSSSEMNNKYAVSWLLTAITGADFVDRGGTNGVANGIVDENDWGYWVKLDYEKFASNYRWRSHYYFGENNYSATGHSSDGFIEGSKETYYLNTIKTRSHTALFIKDVRTDGKSAYEKFHPTFDYNPSSALKLNEVIVLKNEDVDQLMKPLNQGGIYGLTYASGNNESALKNGDTFNKVLDKYDLNQTMRDFMKEGTAEKDRF